MLNTGNEGRAWAATTGGWKPALETMAAKPAQPAPAATGFERLSDIFVTDEDRGTYSKGVRRGGAVVCVSDVDPSEREMIIRVLEEPGAADLSERENKWREKSWTGFAAGSEETYAGGTGTADAGGASTGGLAYSEGQETRETGFAEDQGRPSGMAGGATTWRR